MILLFNLAGYQLFFDFFINRSDQQLVLQVDRHQYHESELITLKIPLQIPYNTDWSNYERIDGEIVVNGIYYNYVGRKFSRDTLYLLCLPNAIKTNLYAARNDYSQQVHALPGHQQNGWHSIKKACPLTEYTSSTEIFSIAIPKADALPLTHLTSPSLIHIFIDTPLRPPCANGDQYTV